MALLQCYCDNSKLVKCCWLDQHQLGLMQIKLMAHVCHILSLPNIKPTYPSLNILLFIIQEKMWFFAQRASNKNSNEDNSLGQGPAQETTNQRCCSGNIGLLAF